MACCLLMKDDLVNATLSTCRNTREGHSGLSRNGAIHCEEDQGSCKHDGLSWAGSDWGLRMGHNIQQHLWLGCSLEPRCSRDARERNFLHPVVLRTVVLSDSC